MKTRTLEAKIKLSRAQARKQYIADHGGYEIPAWLEVHHKDFCALNNEPDNLGLVAKQDHIEIHQTDIGSKQSKQALSEYLDRALESGLNELELWLNVYSGGGYANSEEKS